ncbi:MAG: hypothetical protein GW946_00310 [Candidatus Pacebacteria bacterium]|nr:hypothetical protein [Candidatus Paceibacterota bacterium]PIR60078.1 MAG: hypothetical protein COU67_03455 [Candidatus Pacebacteria bacterium CG10_big_fil_rev_8_21_14_0_10_44_54]
MTSGESYTEKERARINAEYAPCLGALFASGVLGILTLIVFHPGMLDLLEKDDVFIPLLASRPFPIESVRQEFFLLVADFLAAGGVLNSARMMQLDNLSR